MSEQAKVGDGGPAMPTEIGHGASPNEHQNSAHTAIWYGMSLRDYFAAKALQGLLANEAGDRTFAAMELANKAIGGPELNGRDLAGLTAAHLSKSAYQFADAMLEERKPETTDLVCEPLDWVNDLATRSMSPDQFAQWEKLRDYMRERLENGK